MENYLSLQTKSCKNCYKCIRQCPVKAIKLNHSRAQIEPTRCILCGRCTTICPQNAQAILLHKDLVIAMLKQKQEVIASVSPAFVAGFNIMDFRTLTKALKKLGFSNAYEEAEACAQVTNKYLELLKTKQYKNFITSTCPSVNSLIKMYYPNALKYLAPIETPMIVHAKILKQRHPEAKIVYITPCIAAKKEGQESKIIDAVLTFEELAELFQENNIVINETSIKDPEEFNTARYYPINRGIIKSLDYFPEGYEYLTADGVDKTLQVLKNIDNLNDIFLEMHTCEYSCINGPCSLVKDSQLIKGETMVRHYAYKGPSEKKTPILQVDIQTQRRPSPVQEYNPTPQEIAEILKRTNKVVPADQLNCGACGYDTCLDKARAVANGYADIDMCLPYMRLRAESVSYEIIQNSPNGIIVLDNELNIVEINSKARNLYNIGKGNVKGHPASVFFDPIDYILALAQKTNVYDKRMRIEQTKIDVELTIIVLEENNVVFGLLNDIAERTQYEKKLQELKQETLVTTDEVIKKQMLVAQEIASLLGETTAESKVALLKLKEYLSFEDEEGK